MCRLSLLSFFFNLVRIGTKAFFPQRIREVVKVDTDGREVVVLGSVDQGHESGFVVKGHDGSGWAFEKLDFPKFG